ncbi:MAG: hypothetical protein MRJ96_07140 [Nitrospirales bacterium]|nr:hypothetical protein [Nitrospira sp.]MDR4501206.1 hypothetical protein [Nitrospirales bacterium]
MSQISALVAANSLPQLALPLIEAAGQANAGAAQLQSPQAKPQDTVTISPEAAALQGTE